MSGDSTILRQALKEQYHAALAMLTECVEKCPEDLWLSGTHPRTYWRIAAHAAYFTHLYLGQSLSAYQPSLALPEANADWEPYELPESVAPYTKAQLQDYFADIDVRIDPTLDSLDLDAPETGIPWYTNMSKLSHQLLNLRHIQGHVGQLSELLMAHGIDIDWVSKR